MLKKTVIKSIGWVGIASIIIYGINSLTKILLARLLMPEDFGLFAMALIFINFLTMFVGLGVGDTLIVKKEEFDINAGTAFYITVTIGIILSLLSYISAPLIASFFNNPQLIIIIQFLSVILFFDSISVVFRSYMVRELHFVRKSVIEISTMLVYVAVGCILAIKGYGVWSLIWAYALQHLCLMILLYLLSPWKPRLAFEWQKAKEIISLGLQFFSGTFMAWFVTTVDKIIIGKKMNNVSLGYYNFGYNISNMPVTGFTHLLTGIFQPVYAKVSSEKEKLYKAYVLSLKWIMIVALPVGIGLFLVADHFVYVVVGEKWAPMLPLLMILAVYSPFRSFSNVQAQIIESSGMPKKESFFLFIETIILLILIIPGIYYGGITGAGIAFFIARISMISWRSNLLYSLTGCTISNTLVVLRYSLLSTIAMAGIVYFFKSMFFQSLSFFSMLFLISIGVCSYCILLLLLDKKIIQEIKEILTNFQ